MSLACCTSRTKEERTETADLEESNSPITGQQQKTQFTKSDLKELRHKAMKAVVSITRTCNCYSLFAIFLLLRCEKLVYGVQRKRLA
jgi:hypothetical protein